MGEKYWASITTCFDYEKFNNGEFVVTNGSQSTSSSISRMNSDMYDAWVGSRNETTKNVTCRVRVGTGFLKLTAFEMDLSAGVPTFEGVRRIMDQRGIAKARIYVDVPRYGTWGYNDPV